MSIRDARALVIGDSVSGVTTACKPPRALALPRRPPESRTLACTPSERSSSTPSHLLPAQGPITVFIHHNTLHAFEDLPFDEAVKKGAQVFGCQPYLTEDRYREELRRGRIRFSDLRRSWSRTSGDRAGEAIPCFGTRLDLRLAMLQYPLRTGPTEELVWYVAEADALRRVRPEVSSAVRGAADRRDPALGHARPPGRRVRRRAARRAAARGRSTRAWPSCSAGSASRRSRTGPTTTGRASRSRRSGGSAATASATCPPFTTPPRPAGPPSRPALRGDRGRRRRAGPRAADPVLRGVPRPGAGPLAAARAATRGSTGRSARSTASRRPARPLAAGAGRRSWPGWRTRGSAPLESILESLEVLGVAEEEWEAFLSATLLALRGWGGMVRQVEIRGDRAVHPVPAGSLVEFLADPPDARPVRAGLHGPRGARFRRPLERAARRWLRARIVGPLAAERRAAGLPGLPARPGPRALARRPPSARAAASGRRSSRRSRRSRGSSGGGSSTWPTRSGSRPRRSTPSPCTRRKHGRPAGVAAVPGGLLPRRARGVVPPPPGGARPGGRDLRRGRVLRRRDVLPRGGRRPLHPALPGRDPAPALGGRGGRRRARARPTGGGPGPAGRWGRPRTSSTSGSRSFALGALLTGAVGVLGRRSRWSPGSSSRG